MRMSLPKSAFSRPFQLEREGTYAIGEELTNHPLRLSGETDTSAGLTIRGSLICRLVTSSVFRLFSWSLRPWQLASRASRSARTSATRQSALVQAQLLQKHSTATQPKAHWLVRLLARFATMQASARATDTTYQLKNQRRLRSFAGAAFSILTPVFRPHPRVAHV